MKKFKLFALAVFAMLSTDAFAAYKLGDAQVGETFIVDGIEYQVTAKYTPGDGALTPEAIGQVTVIRYANSTLTTAVTIPSQVQSLDVEGTIDPAYKYSVVGIDGAENSVDETALRALGTGGVYKVNTKVKHQPFANCAATSVTLPASVMYIGKGAFEGFKGSAVVIPLGSTLSVIEEGAFFKAAALETFATANATILSEIGANAFYGCAKLASITLGEKLTTIGEGAFIGTAITKLDLSTCKNFWKEATNPTINRLFTAAVGTTAYSFDAGDAAYAQADYTNANLTTVVLPASLATTATAFEIAASAFEGCTALTTVAISETAAAAAMPAYVSAIGAGAFKNTAITKLDLSANTINTIGAWFSKWESATNNKSTLKQVVLKATVGYTIGENLANITSLEKVGTADAEYQLTAGTTLAEGMFANTKLGQLDLSKVVVAELPALFGAAGISSLTAVTLNNGTTSIAANAFAKCVALETLDVKMSNGTAKDLKAIVSVGDGAFYRTKLSSLTFGAALKTFAKPWGTFVEADGAMSLATAITLDLSAATGLNVSAAVEAVEAVGVTYDADEGEKTLAEVEEIDGAVIGDEYTVGNWVEQEDGNYKKVKIAKVDGVEAADAVPVSIPADAFKKLAALTSIKLPTTLVLIGANAFEGTGFASLELPKSIQQMDATATPAVTVGGIGALAFKDSKLAELKFYPATIKGSIFNNDNVFSGCSLVTIYTSKTYKDKVVTAPTFSKWSVSSPEEVTTVKDKVKKQAMKGFISNEPYAFDSEQCVVYEAYFDGDDIVMSPLRKIGGKYNVPANTAVIVRTAEATTITPDLISDWAAGKSSMVYGQLGVDGDHPYGLNELRSVLEETPRANVYKNYMYVLVNNATAGFSFQHYTGSKINKGNIYVINPDKAPGARLNIVWKDENGNVEEDATAIQSIEAAEAENGAIYNLQGVRVNAAKKGLYIKNGKKYIVK